MAFTELSEVLSRLESGALGSAGKRAELAQHLARLRNVFLRLGAGTSAARLDLAEKLVRESGQGAEHDELAHGVRRLLVPIERAFQLEQDPSSAPGETRSAAPCEERAETSGYLRARLGIARDMLLGEMLVHFGVVSSEQLTCALEAQRGSRQRLGDVLVRQGVTSAEEIRRALEHQTRLRAGNTPASERVQRGSAASQPSPALPRGERVKPGLRMTTNLLLGEILVMQGVLTRAQLVRGLELQRRTGRLVGEALLELKLVTRRQLEHALTFQGRTQKSSPARRAA